MKKEFITAFKIYVFSWLLSFIIALLPAINANISLADSVKRYIELLSYPTFMIGIQLLFGILYILFLLIRYFVRIYKKRGLKTFLKRFVWRLCLPIFLCFGSYQLIIHFNTQENYNYNWDHTIENKQDFASNKYALDGKHRGMHVFGWSNNNEQAIKELIRNNIEWVAIVPFLYQKDEQSNLVGAKEMGASWSRRDSSFINTIKQLKENEIHIMLKPHVWVNSGWRANINLSSKEWDTWFDAYRTAMLHYAKLAAETEIELFCIGTELKSAVKEQPEKWLMLIKEIKEIYSGNLTYAANWDQEYNAVSFWQELDYIGIQAYFPLTDNAKPDLNEIKAGWEKPMKDLEELSNKHEKPILFTEIGYRSDVLATVHPWEWDNFLSKLFKKKSDQTQQLAYEALFQKLWDKKWFAGTYVWQWNTRSSNKNAAQSLDFSPRFKPAENTIAKWYGKHSK